MAPRLPYLAVLLVLALCLAAPVTAQETDTLPVINAIWFVKAEAQRYTPGTYKLVAHFGVDSTIKKDNTELAMMLLRLKEETNYELFDLTTGRLVEWPDTVVASEMLNGEYQAKFVGLELNYHHQYEIRLTPPLPPAEPMRVSFLGTDSALSEWEARRSTPWSRRFEPVLVQNTENPDEIGALGFELQLKRKVYKQIEVNFETLVTSRKNDPTNRWKLDLLWRSPVMTSRGGQLSFRLLTLMASGEANQGLTFGDLSGRAFATLKFQPLLGIQPVFATVGFEQATRVARDAEDYDDPRLHIQAQWGMVGLLGRGTRLKASWQYWYRLEDLWDSKINAAEPEERQHIDVTFTYPMADGKNLTLRYLDGELSPTFDRTTAILVGLEILLGERPSLTGE